MHQYALVQPSTTSVAYLWTCKVTWVPGGPSDSKFEIHVHVRTQPRSQALALACMAAIQNISWPHFPPTLPAFTSYVHVAVINAAI